MFGCIYKCVYMSMQVMALCVFMSYGCVDMYMFLCKCVCVCIPVNASLCEQLPLCLCDITVCMYIVLCGSICAFLSVYLCVRVCGSTCEYLCVCVCVSFCVSACYELMCVWCECV